MIVKSENFSSIPFCSRTGSGMRGSRAMLQEKKTTKPFLATLLSSIPCSHLMTADQELMPPFLGVLDFLLL